MERREAAPPCRSPEAGQPLAGAANRVVEGVHTRGQLARLAVRRAVEQPAWRATRADDDVFARDGNRERAVRGDPLPRRPEPADVEKVRVHEAARAIRPLRSIRLREVTWRAN